MRDDAQASSLSEEITIASSNLVEIHDTSRRTVNEFYQAEPPFRNRSSTEGARPFRARQATYTLFDAKKYKELVVQYLLANNLPFAHVDSPSFKKLLEYARYCKTNELPPVSRHTVKDQLVTSYNNEFERLKLVIARHKGRFALTIDEWNSGNGYDFFGVTLHFHTEEFVLEYYTIGFEVLNDESSYTGDVIYERLKQVLEDYDISDRIISITRDNASPISSLLNTFTDAFNKRCPEFEFCGDVRCAGHVLNLSTKVILDFSFFKARKSEAFCKSLIEVEENHPDLKDLFLSMRQLPKTIKAIIKGVRFNHFLKNTFRLLVKARKDKENKSQGPEKLLRDNENRWLSTLMMLERFLYFRPEITELLRVAQFQPPS